MYQTHRTYIKPDMCMADLVIENPSLLLLLERFGMETALNDTDVAQLCEQYEVNTPVFLLLCNLYNGFFPQRKDINPEQHRLTDIIKYIKNSHRFYTFEKYPQIRDYIAQLYERQCPEDIQQLEIFFGDYFEEVQAFTLRRRGGISLLQLFIRGQSEGGNQCFLRQNTGIIIPILKQNLRT